MIRKKGVNKNTDEKMIMPEKITITEEEAKKARLSISPQGADGGDFPAEQRKIGVRKNLYCSASGICRYCKYGQCKDRECKGCPNSYGGSENLCHCMDEVSILLPQCPYYRD